MHALLTYGPTILIFVAVLSLLVLIHEFGHFVAARLFGIDVDEFGIGFPPRLLGIKKGNTTYSINWLPLGGFVKIKGDDDPDNHGPGTFASKPARVRALVIAAGVIMNLVLSSLLFGIGFASGVPEAVEGLPKDARIRDQRIQVVEVIKGSAAEKAGILPGDIIVSVDGRTFSKIDEVQTYVNAAAGPVDVRLRRGQESIQKELTPAADAEAGRKVMGVSLVESAIVSYPWYSAVGRGIYASGFYAKEIFLTFADLIRGLFVGQKPGVELSGPVGIAVLTGQAARLGFIYLLQFAALLSVNLAVINVLPIPALDGGRLLFIFIEKIRGRGIRPIVESVIHRSAFLILIFLVFLVTAGDLLRYKTQLLGALQDLFGIR